MLLGDYDTGWQRTVGLLSRLLIRGLISKDHAPRKSKDFPSNDLKQFGED